MLGSDCRFGIDCILIRSGFVHGTIKGVRLCPLVLDLTICKDNVGTACSLIRGSNLLLSRSLLGCFSVVGLEVVEARFVVRFGSTRRLALISVIADSTMLSTSIGFSSRSVISELI